MKTELHHLSLSDFDYPLPDDRIAQYPLENRDQSRILIYRDGSLREDCFFNIAAHLPPGGTLIFNETKVVHARLMFSKAGGSTVEVFCLEPAGDLRNIQLAFQAQEYAEWVCLVGHSKRWKSGPLVLESAKEGSRISLSAVRVARSGDSSVIRFHWAPAYLTFSQVLETFGKVPLPPYIGRKAEQIDDEHYQTVYARQEGSVAAPTAGLHFTGPLLRSLPSHGLGILRFTLHVGAGTFKPVTAKLIRDHEMHPEQVFLELSNLKKLHSILDKPLILVGTTSVRLLESLYWQGVKMLLGLTGEPAMDIRQWDPYQIGDDHGISRKESLEEVIGSLEKHNMPGLSGETRLMIVPGYRFRYPDVLITNFHQPRSTLLMLIAAFMGDDWKRAYAHALNHEFRFLSYGDSCVFYTNRP